MRDLKTKILIIAGARPNFMKIAPLMKEFKKHIDQFEVLLVHTGQHYDFEMSEVFFRDLDIPKPDIHLNVGSASHAVQVAKVMIEFEQVLVKEKPDLIVVVGDVNSTLACSLVAAKLGIKVAHVEAGLRSFDRTMPEEINRIVTDSLSDYLFVSEISGLHNLKKEGVASRKTFFVGNIMIDTLLANMPKIDNSDILKRHSLEKKSYGITTLHRPSNVDNKESLEEILSILKVITKDIKLIYPIHPRSRSSIKSHGLLEGFQSLTNLSMIEPLGYIDFIKLVKESRFVLTDSGGIQEETTVLKIPCLTMRENTERPVTISEGTNCLVGRDKHKILLFAKKILRNKVKKGRIPRYWDEMTAQRIIKVFEKCL